MMQSDALTAGTRIRSDWNWVRSDPEGTFVTALAAEIPSAVTMKFALPAFISPLSASIRVHAVEAGARA